MKQVRQLLTISLIALVFSCQESNEEVVPATVIINGVNKVEMLNLINSYRAKGCQCGTETLPPVGALVWNDKLGLSAIKHTKDMSSNNYFSHTSQDGRTLETRINAEGYSWSMLGENIAMGQNSEQQVMDGWIKSSGHCKNIMNAGFTEVGFGRDKNYWTQNFGKPR